MTCIDLTSKRSKCWVTSQNIQNKAKLQKWSKSNDLHRFYVKTIKTFETKQNYKSDQNLMTCIDLTSKRSKCWVTSQNIQKKAKLQKWSKSNDLHRFDVKTIKMLRYFAKHSKQRKTTKLIKLQWIASIWCQNDQKTQNYKFKSNYDKFASIWRQNDQNVELRRKTFKTKQNYKSDQNLMTCIDLTSKRSKCWVTSQNIQNNAKLQNWSNYNELHRFDVKTIKKRKTTKSNQITINLRRFDVKMIKMLSYVAKHSKQSKTTKVIKI